MTLTWGRTPTKPKKVHLFGENRAALCRTGTLGETINRSPGPDETCKSCLMVARVNNYTVVWP